ncbi:dihydrofolate reductase family protein [Kroppenstedtia eburnea]|uniref:dihydrofolate reductase family protein n=1 Tax=Kroppenstedtia eburnea TaxID=714067 RepID=UPI002E14B170
MLVENDDSFIREVENLKHHASKISVESGIKTWQRFIQHDFFDDLWLLVHPVIVSQGERLFAEAEKQTPMKLNSSKTYQNGVVGLWYQK